MHLIIRTMTSKSAFLNMGLFLKQSFNSIVIRLMRFLGFYIERMTSASLVYDKLTKDGLVLKENELRKTVNFLRRTNDLMMYDQILRKFIPQLDLHFSKNAFTGSGRGATTLNVYRKVTSDDNVLFEKVYFNSSLDIERVIWFYEAIYSSIKDHINVPPLYKVFRGELISVFYFNYVDLALLSAKDVDSTIYSFSKELYKLSFTKVIKSRIESAPSFLKDYKAHFEYKRKIKIAEQKIDELLGDNFPLIDIEKLINDSPLVLTHGDIHPGNVFKNNYLIDWDPFGLYPIGLEVAYILLFLHKGALSYKDLIQLLEKEYRSTLAAEHWDDFELNCLYFYFVFTIQHVKEGVLCETQRNILAKLYELCCKRMNILSLLN